MPRALVVLIAALALSAQPVLLAPAAYADGETPSAPAPSASAPSPADAASPSTPSASPAAASASPTPTGGTATEAKASPSRAAVERRADGPGAPTLESPADGATVGPQDVARGLVSDEGTPTARVVVTVDDEAAGDAEIRKDTWTFVLPGLDEGKHRIRVHAVDADGQVSDDSAEHTFEVADVETPPVVTAPRDSSTTTDRTPTVRGTPAHADSRVFVIVDGVATKRPQATGTSWSWTVPDELEPGRHTLQAYAVSKTAGRSEYSAEITFTVAEKGPGVPTVSVPAEGATLNGRGLASGTVSPDGTPTTRVLVAVDGVDLGEARLGGTTWTFGVRGLSAGSHVLRVRAVDDEGVESAESDSRTFVVDAGETVPVVVSPADGSVTADRTPTIVGTAAHADSQVLVELDGKMPDEPQATGSRWSWTVGDDLEPGHHELRASSVSRSGRSGWSAVVGFDVAEKGPATPAVVEPEAGSTVRGATTAYGTIPEGGTRTVRVRVLVDRQTTLEAGLGSSEWKVALEGLGDGEHTVAAQTIDEDGVASAFSDEVSFTVDSGLRPPVISTPADGSATADRRPVVRGTAQHTDSEIGLELDGEDLGVQTKGSPWSWAPRDELRVGTHTLRAYAVSEKYGRTGWSEPVTFEVRERGPGVPKVDRPQDGDTAAPGEDAYGSLSDEGTATAAVEVFVDDQDRGAARVEDRRWAYALPRLVPGRHTLAVQAVDADGTVSPRSDAVTFEASTGYPPQITLPQDGTVTSTVPEVSGIADPGAVVVLLVDDQGRAKAAAGDDGRWSVPADELGVGDGRHTLTAYQVDREGQESKTGGPVHFVLDTTPPEPPVVETPSEGDVLEKATFAASGTGDPGATVVVLIDDEQAATAVADAGSGRWEVSVTTPERGRHTVAARQVDEAGNVSDMTAAVTVEAAGPPPAPVLDDFPGGSPTREREVVVQGSAEPGSKLVVLADDTQVGGVEVAKDGTWRLTISVVDGTYAITARSYDRYGGSEPSAARTLVVDTAAPEAPAIVEPSEKVAADTSPEVRGTGEAGAEITLELDGEPVPTGEPVVVGDDSVWAYAWDAEPIPSGRHTLTARQRDLAGNESEPTARDFVVGGPSLAQVSVTRPEDGDVVATAELTVTGRATPDDQVLVRVDGDVVGKGEVGGDGGFTVVTGSLQDGEHVVSVTQRGRDEVESDPVEVTVTVRTGAPDTQAPDAPVVTQPGQDDTVGARPRLSGTGEPAAVVDVYRSDDRVDPVGSTDVDDEGRWTLVTDRLPDGPVTLVVTQTDAAHNVSELDSIDLVVDAAGPAAPTITAPTDGSVLTNGRGLEVTGTGEPRSSVRVYDGSDLLGTALVDAGGRFVLTLADLGSGPHLLDAVAVDAFGNVSRSSPEVRVVVVDRPVILAPADLGTTSDARPTISGTGVPGTQVTVRVRDFATFGVVAPQLALGLSTGDVLASTTVRKDGTWDATPVVDLAHGRYTVVAEQGLVIIDVPPVQRLKGGATSDPVTFAIATEPRITTPADDVEVTSPWTVCGVGEPGWSIKVLDYDDSSITFNGQTTVDADGTWCVRVDDQPGAYVRGPEESLDGFRLSGPTIGVTVVEPTSGPGSDGSGSGGSGSDSPLAATGGPGLATGLAGMVLLAGGGALLASTRRRRR